MTTRALIESREFCRFCVAVATRANARKVAAMAAIGNQSIAQLLSDAYEAGIEPATLAQDAVRTWDHFIN